jgi:uncharacterized protein YndB with AHSA1/START domain
MKLEHSSFNDVEGEVSVGDYVEVKFPSVDGGFGSIEGEVVEVNDGQSIRLRDEGEDSNVSGDDYVEYVLRKYDGSVYDVRVLRDLNPEGKTHLSGLNEQGDKAQVVLDGSVL